MCDGGDGGVRGGSLLFPIRHASINLLVTFSLGRL